MYDNLIFLLFAAVALALLTDAQYVHATEAAAAAAASALDRCGSAH